MSWRSIRRTRSISRRSFRKSCLAQADNHALQISAILVEIQRDIHGNRIAGLHAQGLPLRRLSLGLPCEMSERGRQIEMIEDLRCGDVVETADHVLVSLEREQGNATNLVEIGFPEGIPAAGRLEHVERLLRPPHEDQPLRVYGGEPD